MKKFEFRLLLEIPFLLLYSFVLFFLMYIIKMGTVAQNIEIAKYLLSANAIEYLVVPYLIILAIQFILKGLLNENWKTNIVLTIIVLIVTIISYYKFKILELPFVPSDILLIGNLNQITEFGITFLPISTIFIIIILLIIYIIIVLLQYIINKKINVRKNADKISNYIFRIVIFIIGIVLLYNLCITSNRYVKFNIKNDLGDNYIWMGGNAVFFMHIGDFFSVKPDGYNKENIENIKQEIIKNNNIDNDNNLDKPNVIMIMSESFSNANNIKNVEYTVNPIQNIENLAKYDKNCIMRKYSNTCICRWNFFARV